MHHEPSKIQTLFNLITLKLYNFELWSMQWPPIISDDLVINLNIVHPSSLENKTIWVSANLYFILQVDVTAPSQLEVNGSITANGVGAANSNREI